jgi:ATP-dependent exoDNAse (exonuclease V) alpha subunit
VIEGPAGTGKTTTLAAARDALDDAGRRLVVVTTHPQGSPSSRTAGRRRRLLRRVAVHQHGYRWDEDGHWSHTDAAPETRARLLPGDVLLVDEAGMLDQDTARALFAIADQAHATVALLGDRHQLPAVGRGGVLDLAARWVRPEAHHSWSRSTGSAIPPTPTSACSCEPVRRAGEVFDALLERGDVVVHASDGRTHRSPAAIGAARADIGDQLVIADTREQVGALNAAIRDRRHGAGEQTGEQPGERSPGTSWCTRW